MPASVPSVPATDVVRALRRAGFSVVRVRGSHHVMRHDDGRTVSLPVHHGRDMPKGTLRSVLVTVGMSVDEFRDLL